MPLFGLQYGVDGSSQSESLMQLTQVPVLVLQYGEFGGVQSSTFLHWTHAPAPLAALVLQYGFDPEQPELSGRHVTQVLVERLQQGVGDP